MYKGEGREVVSESGGKQDEKKCAHLCAQERYRKESGR